jgi:hypothetical protein
MKMKEDLLRTDSGKEDGERSTSHQSGTSARDLVKSAMEEKIELRPASPIKSIPEWQSIPLTGGRSNQAQEPQECNESSHAKLSVEIHNEGLGFLIKSPE